jgi:hypothetical protein
MFDFLKPCLDAGGEFLTGTVVVHALDSDTGQGLFGVRAIVGNTLDAAFGKT